MSNQPAVSVLVVNYNTATLTKNCVASLRAQSVRDQASGAVGVEVIVIDNGSRPDERRALEGLDTDVVLNDVNRGYGAALNQALARARGEFIIFSNSDTWYFAGALQKMLDSFVRLPRCGAVGPRLWWDREREFLLPPSDPVTPFSFFCDTVLRRSRWAMQYWAYWWRRRALGYWRACTPLVQPLLSGACLLTRRAVIDVCGGFDERFHLYYEDTDWCRRVRRKGYQLYYVPEAEVAHLYNQSARQELEATQQAGRASLEYYFRKHYGRRCWRLLDMTSMSKRMATRQPSIATDYKNLGALEAPPVFSLPREGKGSYLLQLSPQGDCLPAIARFFSTPHCALPKSVWAQLAEGDFFAQMFSLPQLQLIDKWRWRKVGVVAL